MKSEKISKEDRLQFPIQMLILPGYRVKKCLVCMVKRHIFNVIYTMFDKIVVSTLKPWVLKFSFKETLRNFEKALNFLHKIFMLSMFSLA